MIAYLVVRLANLLAYHIYAETAEDAVSAVMAHANDPDTPMPHVQPLPHGAGANVSSAPILFSPNTKDKITGPVAVYLLAGTPLPDFNTEDTRKGPHVSDRPELSV